MVWRPGAKPWDQPVEDTMDLWPVVGYAGRPTEAVPTVRGHTGRSLPTLCRLLGIPTEANPIDGSEVAAAWYDGRRADVAITGQADVWRGPAARAGGQAAARSRRARGR